MSNDISNNNQTENKERSFAESELVQLITGFVKAVISNKIVRKTVFDILKSITIIISVVAFFGFFLYLTPFLQDAGRKTDYKPVTYRINTNNRDYKRQMSALKSEVSLLERKYRSFTPGQSFLVINTTGNRFYLYRNRKIIREGFCSSGSYTRLVTPEGSREWVFKTPKGKFWIQEKIVKPLWVKPDWAFIEEGLPVPPPGDESRYERGVLGDYAMSLGNGYLIHGTIYKRLLGMPVTHGCIRLNDEDLEIIFNTLSVGSKVYIF
ncbi:MAG: L,D-transpeptidase [Bacteroidales bacterium]|nr:L,D-transpeptidase [Bacteroidales bacterium]